MKVLSDHAVVLSIWLGLFVVFGPYFLWQSIRGKPEREVVGGNTTKRFVSVVRFTFIGGVLLIGFFFAWVRWRHS